MHQVLGKFFRPDGTLDARAIRKSLGSRKGRKSNTKSRKQLLAGKAMMRGATRIRMARARIWKEHVATVQP